MKKTFNLILAGSMVAVAGTAFGQLAPSAQDRQPGQPAHQEQRQALQPEQQPRAQDPAAMQEQLESLHAELEAISIRLNEIHQEALLRSDVRQLLIDYETKLNEKVSEHAPGLEAQVETHSRVLADIEAIDGDGEDLEADERRQLEASLESHAEIKQQLAPIEGQLMNDPEMQAARGEYQQNLIAAMQEVDPEVNEIIQERMELAQNFMALQQELLQSHQPEQGGAAPRGEQPVR